MYEEKRHKERPEGSYEGLTPQAATQARALSSVCTHAQPRVTVGHTYSCVHACSHTLSHEHTHTHWCSLCSKWQTFCRWLILYHVAPKIGKMSKRAYHWLQTYCLHCHINLIQKLSKGPLRFISAFAFIFIFEGRGDTPMIFSHVLHKTFCSKNFGNTAVDNPTSLSGTYSLHLHSKIHNKA